MQPVKKSRLGLKRAKRRNAFKTGAKIYLREKIFWGKVHFQKWKKGQGSSQAVMGSTGVNGLSKFHQQRGNLNLAEIPLKNKDLGSFETDFGAAKVRWAC